MSIHLNETIAKWLQSYCQDVKIIDNEISFKFNDIHMQLTDDIFSSSARIVGDMFDCDLYNVVGNDKPDSGYVFSSILSHHLPQYSFSFDENLGSLKASKFFTINLSVNLEFIIKVEIYRMYYLCLNGQKTYYLDPCCEYRKDDSWIYIFSSIFDKWVAGDILNLNILYLHGFASSGNSGTAKEIQECLPNCKVISPDLPIQPSEALALIHKIIDEQEIDLVIGTSMGGYFAAQISGTMKILVNPSFHVSRMMRNRLGDNSEMTIPYFKAREDGATEFVLTKDIANRYFAMERNIEKTAVSSNSCNIQTLGVFGTDDDVVDCREEYLSMYDNIRYFKGGHRLNKEAVEEVIIPSILQMVINHYENE